MRSRLRFVSRHSGEGRGQGVVSLDSRIRGNDGRRGFTLLEMVLVLLIMGIVFAMVVPSMASLTDDPEEDEVWSEITSLLRWSRKVAVEKSVTVKLIVDAENGYYRADSSGARGGGLVDEGQFAVGLNMSVYTDSSRARFIFRPDGSAFADSMIIRASGFATKLSLDTFSGEIRIEDR